MNKEKLLLELSKDYTKNLNEMSDNLLPRSDEASTIEEAEEYLLNFNPEGDEENTAREAGYLAGIGEVIATIRNFNSLNK